MYDKLLIYIPIKDIERDNDKSSYLSNFVKFRYYAEGSKDPIYFSSLDVYSTNLLNIPHYFNNINKLEAEEKIIQDKEYIGISSESDNSLVYGYLPSEECTYENPYNYICSGYCTDYKHNCPKTRKDCSNFDELFIYNKCLYTQKQKELTLYYNKELKSKDTSIDLIENLTSDFIISFRFRSLLEFNEKNSSSYNFPDSPINLSIIKLIFDDNNTDVINNFYVNMSSNDENTSKYMYEYKLSEETKIETLSNIDDNAFYGSYGLVYIITRKDNIIKIYIYNGTTIKLQEITFLNTITNNLPLKSIFIGSLNNIDNIQGVYRELIVFKNNITLEDYLNYFYMSNNNAISNINYFRPTLSNTLLQYVKLSDLPYFGNTDLVKSSDIDIQILGKDKIDTDKFHSENKHLFNTNLLGSSYLPLIIEINTSPDCLKKCDTCGQNYLCFQCDTKINLTCNESTNNSNTKYFLSTITNIKTQMLMQTNNYIYITPILSGLSFDILDIKIGFIFLNSLYNTQTLDNEIHNNYIEFINFNSFSLCINTSYLKYTSELRFLIIEKDVTPNYNNYISIYHKPQYIINMNIIYNKANSNTTLKVNNKIIKYIISISNDIESPKVLGLANILITKFEYRMSLDSNYANIKTEGTNFNDCFNEDEHDANSIIYYKCYGITYYFDNYNNIDRINKIESLQIHNEGQLNNNYNRIIEAIIYFEEKKSDIFGIKYNNNSERRNIYKQNLNFIRSINLSYYNYYTKVDNQMNIILFDSKLLKNNELYTVEIQYILKNKFSSGNFSILIYSSTEFYKNIQSNIPKYVNFLNYNDEDNKENQINSFFLNLKINESDKKIIDYIFPDKVSNIKLYYL